MVKQLEWTEDDLMLLASMRALGYTLADIGRTMGRSGRAVSTGGSYDPDRLPIVIAQPIDVADNDGRPWQDAELTVLDILGRRGWKNEWIGDLLGRSVGSVQVCKSRRGVVGPRYPSKRKDGSRWRPCMCCQRTFRSEGIHNRLCTECKSNDGDSRDLYR